MLVLLDFGAFLNAEIAGVSVYSFVIFSNQIYGFGNIVLVCRGNRISGSRAFSTFFVELGASMIVASTIVPPFIM